MEWTNDQIARLKELYAAGNGYRKIGDAMGLSRNAVIGKAFRLGLPLERAPFAVGRMPREQSSSAVATATLALTARHCRWPVGDLQDPAFHYCCAPKRFEVSYCPDHIQAARRYPDKVPFLSKAARP